MASRIAELWDRVNKLVTEVKRLEPDEYELFCHIAELEPVIVRRPTKRKRKSSTKSARATGMEKAIKNSLASSRAVGAKADDYDDNSGLVGADVPADAAAGGA